MNVSNGEPLAETIYVPFTYLEKRDNPDGTVSIQSKTVAHPLDAPPLCGPDEYWNANEFKWVSTVQDQDWRLVRTED